ncbi:tripartite tricarboxylate transporter TctB family protein [Bullifex sp.]|uniref:tripartite tricarboxylate transporter TctB family protein n=1 Tax=Bullifex sp. TaxID=2815808 RepID=UPI002A7EF9C8|nr:tripartite tricarboxylate transporter TctB family protein [Bullifex sp.]MDY4067098.1 tripartite tricarboxylate transporter TctB family protein [Bullifex sp.]
MQEDRKKLNPVVIEGIALLAFSVIGVIYSIVSHFGFKVEWKLSPYLFPLFISLMLFVLSISLLLSGLKGMDEKKSEKGDKKTFLLFLAECAIYLVVLRYLGFLISTMILLGAIVRLLGEKNWVKVILISVVTSLIIYFLFGVYLGVMLPKGKLLYIMGIRL